MEVPTFLEGQLLDIRQHSTRDNEYLFNKEGKWDVLNTPLNEDYVKTFKFVYDIFQNNFMIKESTKKITGKPEDK